MERQVKGILGEKIGMTQLWDENNRIVPVTVVKAGPCVITRVRTPERDGYSAVQLAWGDINPRKVSKPLKGYFEKNGGIPPRRHLVEIRTSDASTYEIGQEIGVDIFEAGAMIDVSATSKGKGFTGVMKRHNFKGLGAGHGVQRKHRSPGSIGACATPSRVFPGMKMAGRHGGQRKTVMNLTVAGVDVEKGYLLIRGAVPGPKGGLVLVRNAVKQEVTS
jgi:large subunit ribosomal protein L3